MGKPTFSDLAERVLESEKIWVRLYDGVRVCLTGVANEQSQVFVGKFVPCADNAREYNIRYNMIKELTGGSDVANG